MQPSVDSMIGHTALCLMALLGFFAYTGAYALIYQWVRTTPSHRPLPVVEMWMVYTHLAASVLTCALQALGVGALAEAQTALFLGVALAVSVGATACISEGDCTLYFAAALVPQLAAAGAMAWSWVMYVVSLGCQTGFVSLGASQGILAPILLALFSPQIMAQMQQTCAIPCASPCNLPLHLTFMVLVLLLWYAAPFTVLQVPLQLVAALLVWLDALVLPLAPAYAWPACLLVLPPFLDHVSWLSKLLFGAQPLPRQQLHLH